MRVGTQTQANVTLVTVRAPSTFSDTLFRDLDHLTWGRLAGAARARSGGLPEVLAASADA